MAKPTSPSQPHYSEANGRHVDIRGGKSKVHAPVQNELGAAAIAGNQRSESRKEKGRS